MPVINFLKLKEHFEIQSYRQPPARERHTHIPFTGSPRIHPHDRDKVVLIADPFTVNSFYHIFRLQDIGFAEQLPSRTNIGSESATMVRLWVKKQSMAVHCSPFIVDQAPVW
ncbi:MAG: inorganic pyrophosphatase Ppa [Desulfobacteraceae bacterium]